MLSYPPTWPTPENEAEKFTIARCWQSAKLKARQAGLDPTITVVSFPERLQNSPPPSPCPRCATARNRQPQRSDGRPRHTEPTPSASRSRGAHLVSSRI